MQNTWSQGRRLWWTSETAAGQLVVSYRGNTTGTKSEERIRSYSDALLKGGDLIVGHLFSDGHVHVGHVAEEVDDPTTGRGQLGLGVDHRHQEAAEQSYKLDEIQAE